MSRELMICVAPAPGEKQMEKYPGRLDSAQELIACEAAGASIGHLHARDENLLQTVDATLFREQCRQIREACSLIIEGSTGGAPEHTLAQRCVTFTVPEVETGSLNMGSINMFDGVFQNRWEDIRFYASKLRENRIAPTMAIFDLSHIANFYRLRDAGELPEPYLFELVFDVPTACPYSERTLDLFVDLLPDDANWFVVRYHQQGAVDLRGVIERGGHVRVGFEDSPFLSNGRRATNNVQLVEDACEQAERYGRTVVRADRAREILGMAPLPVHQS